MNRLILTLALILSPNFFATIAPAQDGYSVYGVVQSEYRLGSFRMHPPAGDGWRQVTNNRSALRLVYAEMIAGDAINTRADIVAESFPIPTPDAVPTALSLTLSGQRQQMKQREDLLVGYTRIEPIESAVETHAYTLKTKLSESTQRYETFFVSMAPDKTEYLVVKFTIDEEDYNKQPFFEEFVNSYAKLGYPGVEPASAATTEGRTDRPAVPLADPEGTGEAKPVIP